MARPENPPAYPVAWTDTGAGNDGMSLRDAFAIAALPALFPMGDAWGMEDHDDFAAVAYDVADAMLAARRRQL